MKIIQPSVTIETPINQKEVLEHLERCGRTCYKSEDRITEGSAEKFIKNIIRRGHESILEHFNFTVRFICDRGVTHEIVRHRIAAYSQESTRYANYSNEKFGSEITVIEPLYLKRDTEAYNVWLGTCTIAEGGYFGMLNCGCTPQEARAVLPNSLKTELVMTANIREWRHFLRLRYSPAAHPQMREVAGMLLLELMDKLPVLFEDIANETYSE